MEWLVFSVLIVHYVAKVIDFWPKSEPQRPVRRPFSMAYQRPMATFPLPREFRDRKKRREPPEKVDWKKEGF